MAPYPLQMAQRDSPLRRSDLLNLEELLANRLRKDFMVEMENLMGRLADIPKQRPETNPEPAKGTASAVTAQGEAPPLRKAKALTCHRSSKHNEFNVSFIAQPSV
jgi:hypothetical protein